MRSNRLFDVPGGVNEALLHDLARLQHRMDRLMGALAGRPQWLQTDRGTPPVI
jgi:hypothetical protein